METYALEQSGQGGPTTGSQRKVFVCRYEACRNVTDVALPGMRCPTCKVLDVLRQEPDADPVTYCEAPGPDAILENRRRRGIRITFNGGVASSIGALARHIEQNLPAQCIAIISTSKHFRSNEETPLCKWCNHEACGFNPARNKVDGIVERMDQTADMKSTEFQTMQEAVLHHCREQHPWFNVKDFVDPKGRC